MPTQLPEPNATATSREAAIKARAQELGFDDCRITTAEAPGTVGQFRKWLDEGQHGEMAYLARNAEKRVDPEKVLPGARSIITLACSYHLKEVELPPSGAAAQKVGVISRYARYADYHDVLAERLTELVETLNQIAPGSKSLWYVDTGPLLERDLAQRAGLGFVGKHTNLISRKLGNWIFLSEIITTIPLAPDAPEQNRCGTCERCINACPTAAITAPFQLDARRCISYLTIELKGPMPVELRPWIGNRIYGCDDCLAVCPWNRFAQEASVMNPHYRSELNVNDLLELLALDDAGFKRRFLGTPIIRTKRRGLLRNVCVALGNVGDESCIPALERAASDPEPLIGEHARWAIAQIRSKSAISRI